MTGLTPAATYLQFVLNTIEHTTRRVAEFTVIAEQLVSPIKGGGELYVTGGDQGFALEALCRAAGMMMVKMIPDAKTVKPGDLVMMGVRPDTLDKDKALAREIHAAGGKTLAFASAKLLRGDSPFDFVIDNGLPPFDRVLPGGIGPGSTVANAINLWVFTGELVSAFTRQGLMPTMWQSVAVPGHQERNAKYRELKFHENLTIGPIEAGKIGNEYLKVLRGLFQGLKRTELGKFPAAGQEIASRLKAGHVAYLDMMGHMPPSEVGIPGDPNYFKVLRAPKDGKPLEVTSEDIVLSIAYVGITSDVLRVVNAAKVKAIWAIAPVEDMSLYEKRGDLFIDEQWRIGDAAVAVPGYDVKILPPSGVIQLATYWMIVGEVARRL